MYWISVRGVSGDTFTNDPSDLGKTRYLVVPHGQTPRPGHAIKPSAWLKAVMAHFPPDKNGKRWGDIVFFVHGYNNTVENVALRQKLLAEGLESAGFDSLVISFDWPSGDTALGYLDDRHDATITAFRLVDDAIRLFLNVRDENCFINIHVVAHSMGAFLVREAFRDADNTSASVAWTANQVVFVAGDVSSSSLATGNTISDGLYNHSQRLTNYFSYMDQPLQTSNLKRLGLAPRVGRVGLPENTPASALDVNCTARFRVLGQDVLDAVTGDPTHSWYFHDPQWLQDLAFTLAGKIDRNAIPTRERASSVENDFSLSA